MKLYACSYINFFDNKLETRFAKAESPHEAFKECFPERADHCADADWSDMKAIQEQAFNEDCSIEVVEVPKDYL